MLTNMLVCLFAYAAFLESALLYPFKTPAFCLEWGLLTVWGKTGALYRGSALASTCLLLAITWDRFQAIRQPLVYANHNAKKRVLFRSAIALCVGLGLALFLVGRSVKIKWPEQNHHPHFRTQPDLYRYRRYCQWVRWSSVAPHHSRNTSHCQLESGRGIVCVFVRRAFGHPALSAEQWDLFQANEWTHASLSFCQADDPPLWAQAAFTGVNLLVYAALLPLARVFLRAYKEQEEKRRRSRSQMTGPVASRTFTVLLLLEISLSALSFIAHSAHLFVANFHLIASTTESVSSDALSTLYRLKPFCFRMTQIQHDIRDALDLGILGERK